MAYVMGILKAYLLKKRFLEVLNYSWMEFFPMHIQSQR